MEDLRKTVVEHLDRTRELSDKEILNVIDDVIIHYSKESYIPLNIRNQQRKEIFDSLRRLDILQELLEDPTITEIMVNGYQTIFIEKEGKIEKLQKGFHSKERLTDIVQQIVSKVNRRVNDASPIADSRLEDGSRVNIVLDPVAINGPVLTIRKFPEKPITMKELISFGTISKEAADILHDLVIAGYNIFVCGGTSSGKTTFLNAMSGFIPKKERIITIEDSAELQIIGIENLVRLETRNATEDGGNGIRIRDLIKTSLRMKPDRIIVGEVRGEEALDLLQAMNTGHDGSMSTGHANSAKDMLSRLETMVLMGINMPIPAIRGQIASAIDILIHLGRLRDKSRHVLEITEVLEYDGTEIKLNPLFKFKETGEINGKVIGILEGKRNKLKKKNKLLEAGIQQNE